MTLFRSQWSTWLEGVSARFVSLSATVDVWWSRPLSVEVSMESVETVGSVWAWRIVSPNTLQHHKASQCPYPTSKGNQGGDGWTIQGHGAIWAEVGEERFERSQVRQGLGNVEGSRGDDEILPWTHWMLQERLQALQWVSWSEDLSLESDSYICITVCGTWKGPSLNLIATCQHTTRVSTDMSDAPAQHKFGRHISDIPIAFVLALDKVKAKRKIASLVKCSRKTVHNALANSRVHRLR